MLLALCWWMLVLTWVHFGAAAALRMGSGLGAGSCSETRVSVFSGECIPDILLSNPSIQSLVIR